MASETASQTASGGIGSGGVLEALEHAVRRVGERIGPSVVGVGHQGTGFVVGDGLVATNAHNLRSEEVAVSFADGETRVGVVAAVDPDGDLAAVRVDTANHPPVTWAEEQPAVGSIVFALANPGGRGPRTTFGLVSAVGRSFRGPRGRLVPGSIEHTAPLPRGSSGGPVTDREGRVVAIDTHRMGEGFYLALPADAELRDRLHALGLGHAPGRAQLGVAIVPPPVARRLRAAVGLPDRAGLLVREVREGAPGARAGLRRGDLLVAADTKELETVDDLHLALRGAGATVELVVVRGTQELIVAVELAPLAEPG
jgi:serine protease Do